MLVAEMVLVVVGRSVLGRYQISRRLQNMSAKSRSFIDLVPSDTVSKQGRMNDKMAAKTNETNKHVNTKRPFERDSKMKGKMNEGDEDNRVEGEE